ncbi:MAG: hypothetical protein KGI26_01450 [Thaumarchaeota archaeon]|nr:hypothetical protein [Nitrososphaerota archaeon]
MSVRRAGRRKRRTAIIALATCALVVGSLAVFYLLPHQPKPIILYVDQGNGAVNASNFKPMLSFASGHGFNTVFFQVYRAGVLLFNGTELASFASQAHQRDLKIFFALYLTNSTQTIPGAVMHQGEDGVSLDMSGLPSAVQGALLQDLSSSCSCQTAVTTTDMASPLRPDRLILETYGDAARPYVRQGIVSSVGVFATTSQQDYQAQFQYDLNHSDGVMVFDYAGLLRSGY